MARRCPCCGGLCEDWPCRACELMSGRTQERIVSDKDLRGQSFKSARKSFPVCRVCGRKLRLGFEKNFCTKHMKERS